MNRDLFLAILAMDSYNRGYNEGLSVGGDRSSLGNAKINTDALDLLQANQVRASDFYAVAYDWNGEKVISYRGTDDLIKDANTGYALGGGSTDLVPNPHRREPCPRANSLALGSNLG